MVLPQGDTQKNRNFVNTPMSDELRDMLEAMALEDAGGQEEGKNNAALIRKLIYQEWERRKLVRSTVQKLEKKGLLPKHN